MLPCTSSSITVALVALALLPGCASIRVKPIESDDKTTEGFRYYLPRPYLVVDKPFPVAGVDHLVTFEWTGKDQLTAENYSALPQDIKAALPKGGIITPSMIVERAENTLGTQSTPAGGSAAPNSGLNPTIIPVADWTKYLDKDKTKATPSLLAKDATGFNISVELKKDAPVETVTTAKIVLVACDENGTPKPASLVEIPDQSQSTPFVKGTTAGAYSANGRRADIATGTTFAVGLLIEGKIGLVEGKFLVHQPGTSFVVVGGKPAEASKPEGGGEQSNEVEISGGKGTAKLAGDAMTQPVRKINDYFSILQLPDFDQQYAVQLRSGLGQAELDLALKDGWLLEKAGFKIDNTEIGKFVFKNIQKFADLAEAVARAAWLPASLLTPPAGTMDTQTTAAGAPKTKHTVTVRMQVLFEAQPGVYPILKPKEFKDAVGVVTPETLYTPISPYTVVAFNVKKSVVLELKSGQTTVSAASGSENGDDVDLINNIKSSAAAKPIPTLNLGATTVKTGTLGVYEVTVKSDGDQVLADQIPEQVTAWFTKFTEWVITTPVALTPDKKAVTFSVKKK